MLFLALSLLVLVAPSQQGATSKLLKQYGEQKLNEACYGYEAQRIWRYHCHKAEMKCKAKGYKVSGHDYLPFVPSSSQPSHQFGHGSKPFYSKYEPAVYVRPQSGPTSTVTLYPSTQYYPYGQVPGSQPQSLAALVQALNVKRLSPLTIRVPHDSYYNKNKYYQRGTEQYPSTSFGHTSSSATASGNGHSSSFTPSISSSQQGFMFPTYAPDFKIPVEHANNVAAFKTPVDFQQKYYTGYPSVYNTAPQQLQARRLKREAVHMTKPTEQELDDFEVSLLEDEKKDKEDEIMGTRCVMQEMGYLTSDDMVDLKYAKDEIQALSIDDSLKNTLLEVMDGCYHMAQNLPDSILMQFPVRGELAKSLYYFKCNDKMSTKVCLKHEIMQKRMKDL